MKYSGEDLATRNCNARKAIERSLAAHLTLLYPDRNWPNPVHTVLYCG